MGGTDVSRPPVYSRDGLERGVRWRRCEGRCRLPVDPCAWTPSPGWQTEGQVGCARLAARSASWTEARLRHVCGSVSGSQLRPAVAHEREKGRAPAACGEAGTARGSCTKLLGELKEAMEPDGSGQLGGDEASQSRMQVCTLPAPAAVCQRWSRPVWSSQSMRARSHGRRAPIRRRQRSGVARGSAEAWRRQSGDSRTEPRRRQRCAAG
jgi:hypothetical protein